jgi:hypothetical protein
LYGRVFHEIGRRRVKDSALAAIECDFSAAYGVYRYTSGIRGVLNREAEFNVHRNVAEECPFHANEAYLIVFLPWHIVARTDVYVVVVEPVLGYRLNSLGL